MRLLRTVLFVVAALGASACLSGSAGAQDCGSLPSMHRLKTEPLTFLTARGPVKLSAEIALTGAEQERGLMCRKKVPGDHAMLFVFTPAQPVAFWMKNTLVPLDMLFVDAGGRVFKIVRNAPPLSLAPIPSDGDTVGVIEIAGGRADSIGVQPGDKVIAKSLPHG